MEKVVRRDLLELSDALAAVGNLSGIKFCYAVAKNASSIEKEIKALQTGLKASELFSEFEKKRVELCKKHAEKDEQGRPKMAFGDVPNTKVFVGVDGNEAFEKDLAALKEKYKGELDKREVAKKEYERVLDETIKFKFYRIQLKDVPKNITAGQLKGIIDIVDGELADLEPKEKA